LFSSFRNKHLPPPFSSHKRDEHMAKIARGAVLVLVLLAAAWAATAVAAGVQ
jgi:hypothetical protein